MSRIVAASFAAMALVANVVNVGCSIPYGDSSSPAPLNYCAAQSECPTGTVCRESMCLGTQVDLAGMLIEVHPNSGASFGASTSFIVDPAKAVSLTGAAPTGFAAAFDVHLPALVSITSGTVHLEYASSCMLSLDNSFPAKIELQRIAPFLGFSPQTYTAEAARSGPALPYTFSVDVPPGLYDVYVTPRPVVGCTDDTPPPVLYANQLIEGKTAVEWGVIKPTWLKGDIHLPAGAASALNDWLLDIVEPSGGRVISTTQTLKQTTSDVTVGVNLRFVWSDMKVSPYIRLRPPEGMFKPSVYWGLWESLLGSSPLKPQVHLSVASLLIEPHHVEMRVEDADHKPVVSAVAIQSIKLSGDVATNAAYGTTLPATRPDGVFTAELPSGTYRIRVTPAVDDAAAVFEKEVAVSFNKAADGSILCFCGQTIVLPPKAVLRGSVFTPSGNALIDAVIDTAPSQTKPVSYWSVVHALDPFLPRTGSAVSDVSGGFSLSVDPGPSDLSVRPGNESGYPWLVRPRVTVQPTDNAVVFDHLTLPSPAILRGTVVDPLGMPVANADIAAWVPVHEAGQGRGLAGTGIQIAGTSTDANGRYTLTLPAMISQ